MMLKYLHYPIMYPDLQASFELLKMWRQGVYYYHMILKYLHLTILNPVLRARFEFLRYSVREFTTVT